MCTLYGYQGINSDCHVSHHYHRVLFTGVASLPSIVFYKPEFFIQPMSTMFSSGYAGS